MKDNNDDTQRMIREEYDSRFLMKWIVKLLLIGSNPSNINIIGSPKANNLIACDIC